MKVNRLKLKQASVVLGVSPKQLQNLVQFQVVRPKKTRGLYLFDRNTLLQAKCALYMKQALGASTKYLARFVRALGSVSNLPERRTVRIQSRPRKNLPPVEIILPVGTLMRALDNRLPLAVAAQDLPRGRKRPGWKEEFLKGIREAAHDLPDLSDGDILRAVRDYRREARAQPAITPGSKT